MIALVTGGTGLIGSVLTRRLVESGNDVRVLHRKNSPLDVLGPVRPAIEFIEGDVLDAATLVEAADGVDVVFHLAAHIGYASSRDWQRLYSVNVEGTRNTVNAALRSGVKRLVHTSSIAALGRPDVDEVTIDESFEWHASRANTYYARSKHLAELEVQRGVAEGLDAVLVNPTVVFGTGRPGENTRFLVDQVRRGRAVASPAGGTNFVDAVDVAEAHLRACEKGRSGERYILGGENLLWRDAFSILAEAFDVSPPRFVIPPRLAVTAGFVLEGASLVLPMGRVLSRETARAASRVYRYDNTRARLELGCEFRPFRETAARIAEELAANER